MGPTVPDLQGLFLRGYGSQTYAQVNGTAVGLTSTMHTSGPLGQEQGDAARNIYGQWAAGTGGSLFYVAVPSNSGAAELAGGTANTGMDLDWQVMFWVPAQGSIRTIRLNPAGH